MPNTSETTFVHAFAFSWKEGTTDVQRRNAEQQIRAFQGVIPGLHETYVGQNLSPRSNGYTFGGVMHFTDRNAYVAYETHPAHMALLTWLVPLIDVVELDLER